MKKKILIVDDCTHKRKEIRNYLEGLNCSIDEADDGEKAFEYCMTKTPDIIVLDAEMPNLDGMGFLRLYKDTFGLRKKMPAIIFEKDKIEAKDLIEVKSLGITDCFAIPLEQKKIRKSLGQLGVE